MMDYSRCQNNVIFLQHLFSDDNILAYCVIISSENIHIATVVNLFAYVMHKKELINFNHWPASWNRTSLQRSRLCPFRPRCQHWQKASSWSDSHSWWCSPPNSAAHLSLAWLPPGRGRHRSSAAQKQQLSNILHHYSTYISWTPTFSKRYVCHKRKHYCSQQIFT